MITPDSARALIMNMDNTEPWTVGDGGLTIHQEIPTGVSENIDSTVATFLLPDDANLAAAAPDLAETIAGMKHEWGVLREYRYGAGDPVMWFPTEGYARKELSNPNRKYGNPRLIRRLVGPVEEA